MEWAKRRFPRCEMRVEKAGACERIVKEDLRETIRELVCDTCSLNPSSTT